MSECGVGDGLGVIFDIDGVLVDSYDAHYRSWQRLADATGVTFNERLFADTFGMTSREIIRTHWPATSHDDASVAELDGRKEAWYREIVSRDFPVMAGAVNLIDALVNADFSIGAGSSGPPENVALALAKLGRASVFTGVVTGMDVKRGKPAPDVFLLCAQKMGRSPADCVVIEDAPAGVRAARAAGMRVVAFASRGRKAADYNGLETDKTVESLKNLSPAMLTRIIIETARGAGPR